MIVMPGIKAVLIDIDDCILPVAERKDIPADVISASFTTGLLLFRQIVAVARLIGLHIGICSGRERAYCRPILIALGNPGLSIVESGAFLFNPRGLGGEETIPVVSPVTIDIFKKVYWERIKYLCQQYPEIVFYDTNEVNIALELKNTAKITISQLAEMVRELLRDTSPLPDIHESSIAVDISPTGINKGSGVRSYSQYTGIPLEQMLGIGDSRGDFPMLELVGHVGCPQNASDVCKAFVRERGGWVSDFYYAQGVVDVIQHFTGIKTS